MAKPGGSDKLLEVHGRQEWRSWLKRNHTSQREIWLIHYKKHAGKQTVSYEDAVEEALCFGWIDGLLKRIDDEKYMLRYTPRRRKSIWSQTNKKRATRLMRQGRMTEAGLAKIREAKQNGEWQKAAFLEGPAGIPADLKRALATNRLARLNFENLAPSYRKQFIHWVASARKDETKERRIKETIHLLKQNKKLGMK